VYFESTSLAGSKGIGISSLDRYSALLGRM
jgi:hypothetical protein